ncbi:ATPase [Pandoraea thiooxydans]|nr:cation-translocating P-type ATPase [Pandoraea thiooxydans]APR93763.1 ATPase [Pandoraea thiooxydans]
MQSAETAARRLGSDIARGLGHEQAASRLLEHGRNEIAEARRRSVAAMIAAQFSDVLILFLFAAAIVSGLIGDIEDAAVILMIVLLNGVIGFFQDFRAERAMAELKQLGAYKATVVRDGQHATVAAAEIVPGDIVLLDAGAVVPADLRLAEAPGLRASEAVLTGEAIPVEKITVALSDAMLPLADRANMLFKGTVVTYGRARGVVVSTGMQTEIGKIAALLDAVPTAPTPLQKRLSVFGRQLALGVLVICALIFAVGIVRGEPVLLMTLTALSLAVAAIPEALPAVVTVMLALGARAMARRAALVRRLPAVETLGSVSYICTDKTGTLTQNEMRVVELCAIGERRRQPDQSDGGNPRAQLLTAAALCNDAGRDASDAPIGDPTEIAMWRVAREAGFDKQALEQQMPRCLELPFDSERKRMTTVHRAGADFVAYTKGAPEIVMARCVDVAGRKGEAIDRPALLAAARAMAADGLRVLAVASRHWVTLPDTDESDTIEQGLTLLGFVGMEDPPRPEARAAVATCKAAGITPVMITGDHPVTAQAIARSLGILGDGDRVLTGRELSAASDAQLAAMIDETKVYARVDPTQKIRIVQAIQASGKYVAMTGDGVNDAPALACADIGVAMGKTGTDVAREAASVVLLDDNFASIVAAVEEGRRIFDNIRKFIRYALACNAAEIWVIALAPVMGLPLPLLPIHILWINLVTDGLPGLALAAEPAEQGAMRRPPRAPDESLFAHGLWQHIVWVSLLMSGISLLTQAGAIHLGSAHWQTMTFTVLALSQMGHVLAIRSERISLFQQGLGSNRPLLGAVLLTIALQLLVIYVPVMNTVFKTVPLTLPELLVCLCLSSVVFGFVEIEKWLIRRRWIYQ